MDCRSSCTEQCGLVCGVDEAGRGPLAGAVFAAAVVLDEPITCLNDSKKLTPKRREEYYQLIASNAKSFFVASATVEEIENTDILSASQLAMRRAVEGLNLTTELALVDGNIARDFPIPAKCVVKGDGKCSCIAAASILAKVTRDRYMLELAERYPQYGFEKHKGYGTAFHIEMLKLHGACPEHRTKFIRKLI